MKKAKHKSTLLCRQLKKLGACNVNKYEGKTFEQAWRAAGSGEIKWVVCRAMGRLPHKLVDKYNCIHAAYSWLTGNYDTSENKRIFKRRLIKQFIADVTGIKR